MKCLVLNDSCLVCFGSLLMLFTPWWNEQTDLMGSFSSYQEHYIARYNEISEQMRQYAVCSED